MQEDIHHPVNTYNFNVSVALKVMGEQTGESLSGLNPTQRIVDNYRLLRVTEMGFPWEGNNNWFSNIKGSALEICIQATFYRLSRL